MALISKVETAAKKIAQAERARHGKGPVCCSPRIAQIVSMKKLDIAAIYDRVVGDYMLADCFYPEVEPTRAFVDHSYNSCGLIG